MASNQAHCATSRADFKDKTGMLIEKNRLLQLLTIDTTEQQIDQPQKHLSHGLCGNKVGRVIKLREVLKKLSINFSVFKQCLPKQPLEISRKHRSKTILILIPGRNSVIEKETR